MNSQIEGSRAVAEAVALSRPAVISACPMTAETHIMAALRAMAGDGSLASAEFVRAESPFAAMSVAIAAAGSGARAYTVTASQGLLQASEAVFNAASLALPVVMTVANRATEAPVSIVSDHSDAMFQRDSGWVQLYAQTAQEAADLHIQAFRLAEELSAPVMVSVDGTLLSQQAGLAALPSQEEVDRFAPPPRPGLDPAEAEELGVAAGVEELLTEVRYLTHARQLRALGLIPGVAAEFLAAFGRDSGGLVRAYRVDDAQTVVVALGSVLEVIRDAVDDLREDGVRIGMLGIIAYRPFPLRAVRQHLANCRRLVVVERALAPGLGGILASDVESAMHQIPMPVDTVIAGLGGRRVSAAGLRQIFASAHAGSLEPLTFLDLDSDLLGQELQRPHPVSFAGAPPAAPARR